MTADSSPLQSETDSPSSGDDVVVRTQNLVKRYGDDVVLDNLSPFWILGLIEFGLGLIVAWLAYDLPIRGSLLLLFGVAGVYLIVALGIGLWISTVVDTQQQAMLVTFFVLVIYLLMSGLFTPISSMPTWAEWVAEFSPLKHFIKIMRQVLMKGAGPLDIWQPTVVLAGYGGVVLSVAVRQYSKTKA